MITRLLKLVAWTGGIVLALLLTVVLAAPAVVESQATKALSELGVENITIEDVGVNLFLGKLDIDSTTVSEDSRHESALEHLSLDIAMTALLSRQLHIQSASLTGGEIAIHADENGLTWIAGILLGGNRDPAEPAAESGPPWSIRVDDLQLDDVRIRYVGGGLESVVDIDRGSLRGLDSANASQATRLEVTGELDGADFEVSAQAMVFAAEPSASATLQLDALALEPYLESLSADSQPVNSGALSTDLEFSLARRGPSGLGVTIEGQSWVDTVGLAIGNTTANIGRIDWSGTATLELGDNAGMESSFDVRIGDTVALDRSAFEVSLVSAAIFLEDVTLATDLTGDAIDARVGNLRFGEGSFVSFTDESVSPAYSTTVALNRLSVAGLVFPDDGEPAALAIEASEGEQAVLAINGPVRPFAGQPAAELALSLSGFDLTRVSAYLEGYDIERGRLAVESTLALSDNKLDMQNRVILDRFRLSSESEEGDELLGDALDMPLDIALDLLRDKDDRIELDLPVTGSLDDLSVDTGDVFRQATQAAVQKAAVSYVTSSLQPLGALLFVSKAAGKASRPRFEPLEFEAGSGELPASGSDYLAKIASLLVDRPRLSITFCGVATATDLAVFEAAPDVEGPVPAETVGEAPDPASQLLSLAEARGNAVQAALQDVYGIDPERLFRCRAIGAADDASVPRVELSL